LNACAENANRNIALKGHTTAAIASSQCEEEEKLASCAQCRWFAFMSAEK